jgi:dihydroorotase (multifunctional complex type)
MSKIDLIIKNGEICTADKQYKADIAVADGKIVAIGDAAHFPEAEKVIDASGKITLPGVIFTHSHYRDPGYTHKEDITTGSRASAAGGATMSISMTNVKPVPTTLENFQAWVENSNEKSLIDFALYGGYGRTTSTLEEVDKLAKAGAIGIKVFQFEDFKADYPHVPELSITDWGTIHEIFEQVKRSGIPVAVHPGFSDWANKLVVREFIDKGKVSIDDYHEVANKGYLYGHEMVMGAQTLTYIAKLTGAKLLLIHMGMMKEEGYEVLARAKAEGIDAHGEMECNVLFMTEERSKEQGIYNLGFKGFRDKKKSWAAINDEVVDFCIIEHAPHTLKEIEPALKNAWEAHTGPMGSQEFLPLMLTAVNDGLITLNHLVKMTSENSAKFFKIWPKKGAMQTGSDADLTIIDLNKEDEIKTENMLSKCGYTPWNGYKVKGMPTHTIVRGKVIMDDNKVIGEAGFGEFVPGPGMKK